MLMFFSCFLVFVYFVQLFITVVPTEYWCKLPHVEEISSDRLKKLLIPSSKVVPYEGHQLPYSRCWIYDVPVDKIILADQPGEDWPMRKCDEWEFKFSRTDVPYASIATEQGWVCDAAYKTTLAVSIFFIGSICGGFIFGWLSDKHGRIPVLIGTNMIGFIGGVSTIYASSFWQFCLCRFIVGIAYDNVFVVAYILVLEYVGPKWRTFAANMSYGIFYSLAAMCLPWIAHSISDWRTFALVTSVPLASVIVTPFIIPESVRWLISKGKIEKAVRIMMKIEKINRTNIPRDIYENFLDDCVETAETLAVEDYSIAALFRTKRLRRMTLLLMISWSVISMAYDGHIRCLDSLGMDVFTTFTIASSTEFPAELLIIFFLDVCGRRWSLFVAVTLSGVFSFVTASVPLGVAYASLAMVSRFFINVASNIGLQFAAELLPTVVRCEGVAFIHIMGHVAAIVSPFVAFSSKIQYNLPMIILGIACVFAGFLCLFLPETLKEELPQNLLDGELFGIDQTFWEIPFMRKRRPSEPKGHYLHAKRPVSRPALLRSSMLSGHLGNLRRHQAVRARAEQIRRSALSTVTSPIEYVDLLRRRYEEMRNRVAAAKEKKRSKLESEVKSATSQREVENKDTTDSEKEETSKSTEDGR
ncbi:Solute carrier family 22 member 5 [Harpegnathos saltator]|uniref:Solute carrier family 22 member 5 n=2 Tax=Harpegnathos saltator TaxID=610380 RepID=E2BP46_HARSA|nr:Solute carrier family 22 member 5 [Harpegnathos saltator]